MKRIAFVGALLLSVVVTAVVVAQASSSLGQDAPKRSGSTNVTFEGGTAYVWEWKGDDCIGVTKYVITPGTDSRGALDGSPAVLRKTHMSVVGPEKK